MSSMATIGDYLTSQATSQTSAAPYCMACNAYCCSHTMAALQGVAIAVGGGGGTTQTQVLNVGGLGSLTTTQEQTKSWCNFHKKYWDHIWNTICPDCYRNPDKLAAHVDHNPIAQKAIVTRLELEKKYGLVSAVTFDLPMREGIAIPTDKRLLLTTKGATT